MTATPVVAIGAHNNPANYYSDTVYGPALQKFDSVGNTYPHGHRADIPGCMSIITSIKLDVAGNAYVGCSVWGNYYTDEAMNTAWQTHAEGITEDDVMFAATAAKLDPNGIILWHVNHKAPVFSIAIDEDGNLYTFGVATTDAGVWMEDSWRDGGGEAADRTGYYTTRKYNSAGVLQWSADHGFSSSSSNRGGIFYKNGYVYTIGSGSSIYGMLCKYDADTGAVIWRTGFYIVAQESLYPSDLVVDSSDNIYLAGAFNFVTDRTYFYWIVKYNSDGELIDKVPREADNIEAEALHIVLDSSENVIVCSRPYFDGYYFYKYDSDLNFIEKNSSGIFDSDYYNLINGIAIDADDNIYFCSRYMTSDYSVYKLSADLSAFVWFAKTYSRTIAEGYYVDVFSIDVREVETPPLLTRFRLGKPTYQGDRYAAVPGLPLSVSLSTPALYRDYIGRALPQIYRVYLIGGTDPVEVMASFISIRKTSENLAVTVVVPGFSEADLTAIEALEEGTIVIQKGIRWPNGSEQLDTLVEIALSGFRYDGGVRSQSLTLLGAGAASGTHTTTRRLTGISYRNSSDGIRRIRCALDTYVQPGDTADLGNDETLVVGDVSLTIRPDQALMELVEAVP